MKSRTQIKKQGARLFHEAVQRTHTANAKGDFVEAKRQSDRADKIESILRNALAAKGASVG